MLRRSDMLSRYDNIAVTWEGTKMHLEIETDEEKVKAGPSGSGKSIVIATTSGAAKIPYPEGGPETDLGEGDDPRTLSLNLTLYRKP